MIDVPNVIPDGIVIPMKGIYGVYRDGDMHDKPMIFGSTRDEDKLFMFVNDDFVERPLSILSPISEYFELYVKPKDPKFYDAYGKYMAESWKYGAVDLPSKFTSTNKNSNDANLKYVFKVVSSIKENLNKYKICLLYTSDAADED